MAGDLHLPQHTTCEPSQDHSPAGKPAPRSRSGEHAERAARQANTRTPARVSPFSRPPAKPPAAHPAPAVGDPPSPASRIGPKASGLQQPPRNAPSSEQGTPQSGRIALL